MEVKRTIEKVGTGFWGYGNYELVLFTEEWVRTDRTGSRARREVSWRLAYRAEAKEAWGQEEFASPEEREAFMQRNIHSREFRKPSEGQYAELLDPDIPHVRLMGDRLYSVEFILDYVILHFDQGQLQLYVDPRVEEEGRAYAAGEAGYRDALCQAIGRNVTRTDELMEEGLVIEFDNGVTVLAPTVPPDTTPEAAMYAGEGTYRYIWR